MPDQKIDPKPENGYVSSEFATVAVAAVVNLVRIFAGAFHASPEFLDALDKSIPWITGLAGAYVALRSGLKAFQVHAAAKANQS